MQENLVLLILLLCLFSDDLVQMHPCQIYILSLAISNSSMMGG